jgi:hypothetical protein
MEEPIALEKWFVFQTRKAQPEPRAKSESRYFSQDVSRCSEIPRGHIETQESQKVSMDSLRELIDNRERCVEVGEGRQARGGARAWR